MEISSFNCLPDLGMEEEDDPRLFLHQHWPHVVDSTLILEDNYHNNNNNSNHFHQINHYSHHNQLLLDFQRGTIDVNNNSLSDSQLPLNGALYTNGPRTTEEASHNTTNSLNISPSPLDQSTGLSNNNNNVLAERKRREKLSQMFIALSTLVPGLKKMDKATVLGDAINHIKQLQHKVKSLEDESRRPETESFMLVKKYKVYADDTSENICSPLPEIEARFCDKDVLISIHCEKRKGVLENTVAEIEKLHLSVVNSSVMSFGDSSINITLVARKDEEFNVNVKELVKNIRCALKKFM